MSLNNSEIQEFKKIWRNEYGTDITDAEAREYGENLVGLIKVLLEIDNDSNDKRAN